MSLSIAIVGLPNVGKSTLFNALLKQQAALAANYPFATIEPNVGVVPVPDSRLQVLADIVGTSVIKPATVEFVDIAGLVKGASEGEGLGNKFLANIRECDLICHVVRDFSDEQVLREGSVDAKTDLETIQMELLLADLSTLEKQKAPKGKVDKEETLRWQIVEEMKKRAEAGKWVRSNDKFQIPNVKEEDAERVAKELNLLTSKDVLYVVNVDEDKVGESDSLVPKYVDLLGASPDQIVIVSAKIESELASLSDEDQQLYLADLGLKQSGLERLIAKAYTRLGLQSFLTAGELEVKAWTIRRGTLAPQAAGVIHTDFEKKFIKAKVASYADFVEYKGWKGLKEVGKVRQEGRDYVMQEGDVVEFAIGS